VWKVLTSDQSQEFHRKDAKHAKGEPGRRRGTEARKELTAARSEGHENLADGDRRFGEAEGERGAQG